MAHITACYAKHVAHLDILYRLIFIGLLLNLCSNALYVYKCTLLAVMYQCLITSNIYVFIDFNRDKCVQ